MKNKIYFTTGPSQLFYSCQDHMKYALEHQISSLSHRSKAFQKIIQSTTEIIKHVLDLPDGYHIYFLSSSNEAWDRIIQNLIINSSYHFVNGAFGRKFYEFTQKYQLNSLANEVADGRAFTHFDVPEKVELIAITKSETSVGYHFSEEEIRQIRKANPNKLIALDVVSASPGTYVDFSQVDTAYLSVQKMFGMPAGLALWIVNEKAHEKAMEVKKHKPLGSYRSLPNLNKYYSNYQTPETPNMLAIYVLGEIAMDMQSYGIERIRRDTTYKGILLQNTVSNHPLLEHFVQKKESRSTTAIVAKTQHVNTWIEKLEKQGLVIGSGYGLHAQSHIRFGNFPAHSKESIELLCDQLLQMDI